MTAPPTPEHRRPLQALQCAQERRANTTATLTVIAVLLALAAVFVRTAQLQLDTPPRLADHISERVSRLTLDAPRGDIRDRRGRLLAVSRPGYQLVLDPHQLLNHDQLANNINHTKRIELKQQADQRLYNTITQLTRLLEPQGPPDDPTNAIAHRIVTAAQRTADRTATGRSPLRYARLTDPLDDHHLQHARAIASSTRGLSLQRVATRTTNTPAGAAPIVGIVGFEHQGLTGAEQNFNHALAPRHGHIDYTRDASGKPLWIDADDYTIPARGNDIHLSIDAQLQNAALEELTRGVHDANAAGGRLVLLDPRTGELLAIADYINPNIETTPFDTELANQVRDEDLPIRFQTIEHDPNRDTTNPNAVPALARNRCVEHVYEPGSTFKTFIWAAILAHNAAHPLEEFDTEKGRWRTPDGRIIEDVHAHDTQTWRDVLINSSNIGMIKGVHRLSPEAVRDAITKFGFGSSTNLPLPGESNGIVTPLTRWKLSTHTSVSMGYEVAVTPVQMARAFAAFARTGPLEGTLPTLTLNATHHPHAFDTNGAPIQNAHNTIIRRVLPPVVAAETRDTLQHVARNMLDRMQSQANTATNDRQPDQPFPWTIFGKSGTSKIARPDGRGYLTWQYTSSFVAAAPLDNPRLVIVAVIDDPDPQLARRRLAFGSQVAGPVAARTLHRALDYLGVPLPAADDTAAPAQPTLAQAAP